MAMMQARARADKRVQAGLSPTGGIHRC